MSLTTFFQFTHTSFLPLPPTKLPSAFAADDPAVKPETAEQIEQRGLDLAIRMLHEPETMIALNPLVQHYNIVRPNDPDASEHMVDLDRLAESFNVALADQSSCSHFRESKNGEFVHYEIVDKFTFLGGLSSKLLTYQACFRPLYQTSPGTQGRQSIGLETISDPGSGVALLGKWTVSIDDRKPGFLVLTETVKVHCNMFLSWYVKSQLESSHDSLHKEFGRKFCERMVAEDPMKDMTGKAGRTWKESEEAARKSPTDSRTGNTSVNRVGTDETS